MPNPSLNRTSWLGPGRWLARIVGQTGNEMSWQNDTKRRVAAFPAKVQAAHAHSSQHRAEIMDSTLCGCFYCGARFPPSEIVEWADEDEGGEGQTALCPKCGIDSVIGDRSGFDISEEFLATMKAHWF